jgi:cell division protein FtsQ
VPLKGRAQAVEPPDLRDEIGFEDGGNSVRLDEARTRKDRQMDRQEDERDDGPRFSGPRLGQRRNPWWRPASSLGRTALLLSALIVVGGLSTSAYLLKNYIDRDNRYRIAGTSNIEASGLTEVSRAEMLPVFGEDIGRNIFFVPLGERRKQLEEIPWIERATVMRLLPDQIRVSVVERQPVAFVRQGQQIGLVDANGVLLTMPAAMMAQRHYSFPVVTGINAQDAPAARKARMAVYQRLLAELDANGQRISEQISEIDLMNPADARVLLPEQGTDILAHFGEDHFLERYQRYKAHINEWRAQYPKLAAVDLRYEQHVVLEMSAGSDVAQAAAEEQGDTNSAAPSSATGGGQNAGGSSASGANAPPTSVPASSAIANPPADSSGSKTKAPAQNSAALAKAKPVKASAGTSAAQRKSTAQKKIAAQKKASSQAKVKAQKASAAKARETLAGKKRAAAKTAVLNAVKHKDAPTNFSATSAGLGQ